MLINNRIHSFFALYNVTFKLILPVIVPVSVGIVDDVGVDVYINVSNLRL